MPDSTNPRSYNFGPLWAQQDEASQELQESTRARANAQASGAVTSAALKAAWGHSMMAPATFNQRLRSVWDDLKAGGNRNRTVESILTKAGLGFGAGRVGLALSTLLGVGYAASDQSTRRQLDAGLNTPMMAGVIKTIGKPLPEDELMELWMRFAGSNPAKEGIDDVTNRVLRQENLKHLDPAAVSKRAFDLLGKVSQEGVPAGVIDPDKWISSTLYNTIRQDAYKLAKVEKDMLGLSDDVGLAAEEGSSQGSKVLAASGEVATPANTGRMIREAEAAKEAPAASGALDSLLDVLGMRDQVKQLFTGPYSGTVPGRRPPRTFRQAEAARQQVANQSLLEGQERRVLEETLSLPRQQVRDAFAETKRASIEGQLTPTTLADVVRANPKVDRESFQALVTDTAATFGTRKVVDGKEILDTRGVPGRRKELAPLVVDWVYGQTEAGNPLALWQLARRRGIPNNPAARKRFTEDMNAVMKQVMENMKGRKDFGF